MLLFADLHCSPQTLEICLDVLRGIHAKAIETKQKIGFLGDFFDTVYRRGTIPVDMLNTLLEFFEKEWSIDMIMIPGNHDYIDASEKEHALEPFRHASKYIHVLDDPCVRGNVLWVPWKRDNDQLRSIFKQFAGQYQCIFGHFDVIGAHVNNNTPSDRGLKKEDFPCDVISGHYHKPQRMGKVIYIGSTYQTSMSEAGQNKRFIFYKEAGDFRGIPIRYGPKRFKVTENPDTWPALHHLQNEDILYMDSFNPEKLSPEAEEFVEHIRTIGVVVVLQRYLRETVAANSLLSAEKELSPEEMFKLYAMHFNLQDEPGYKQAIDLINKMDTGTTSNRVPSLLNFNEISFEGFGPFQGKQIIKLDDRGLAKITGKWMEGAIGSSNGAGKSMATVSAFLWCLTGYSDMRASTSLKKGTASAACINQKTRMARVEIVGDMGGTPFKIYRACSLIDKTSFLEVFHNNERITRSTQHQTQFMLNSMFFRIPKGKTLPKAPNKRLHAWLMRTLVWEQAGGCKNWLETNDKGTKEELLLLCNMNIWEDLFMSANEQYLFSESNIRSTGELLANALRTQSATQSRKVRTLQRLDEWRAQQHNRIESYRSQISTHQKELEDLGPQPVLGEMPVNHNKRKYQDITRTYYETKKSAKDAFDKATRLYRNDDSNDLDGRYTVDVVSPVYDRPAPEQKLIDNAIAEAGVRKQQLLMLKKAASAPTACPTCKQSIQCKHIEPSRIVDAQTEYGSAMKMVTSRKKAKKMHEFKVKEENKKQERIAAYKLAKSLSLAAVSKQEDFTRIEKEKTEHEFKQAEWAATRVLLQHWEHKRQTALSALRLINRELLQTEGEIPPIQQELADIELTLKDGAAAIARYKELKLMNTTNLEALKNMRQWLGVKGIQTYVVERMLHKISKHTTDWCKYLFDAESQGSPVFSMELDDNETISKELTFGPRSTAHALSGGQYRRLQIASFMAWRMQSSIFTGVHSNLAILDEPAANIDTVGFKQMEQALKDWAGRSQGRRTCMFISHDVGRAGVDSLYDTHIEIRAKAGASFVHDYDDEE